MTDSRRRVRALEQLGRDTVKTVLWSLSEAEALFLDRSMRAGVQATALEEGWLLAEMSERFGYDQEEVARRFDRSVSWVSRRMGLIELPPAQVQRQVSSGAITAHVATWHDSRRIYGEIVHKESIDLAVCTFLTK